MPVEPLPPILEFCCCAIASAPLEGPLFIAPDGLSRAFQEILVEVLRWWVGPERFVECYDAAKLLQISDQKKLAVLYAQKLTSEYAWKLTRKPPCTILWLAGAADVDELPGPWVRLHASLSDAEQFQRWIINGSPLPPLPLGPSEPPIATPAVTDAYFDFSNRPDLDRQRNLKIFRNVLLGSYVLEQHRSVRQTVDVENYRQAYELLTGDLLGAAEDRDPLTTALIGRTQALLKAIAHGGDDQTLPAAIVALRKLQAKRAILLPMLADLGDPRTTVVRMLVQKLQSDEGPFRDFQKCGLASPWRQIDDWCAALPGPRVEALVAWSYKQAYRRIKKLNKLGLLLTERVDANGPITIHLPESLNFSANPFTTLTPPDEVERNSAQPAPPDFRDFRRFALPWSNQT